jgi:hypothetical protein
MFNQFLLVIYNILIQEGWERSSWIERDLELRGQFILSIDDIRNERSIFEKIFSEEYIQEFERIYLRLLDEICGRTYEQCHEQIEALKFISLMVDRGRYKHRVNVGAMLETFSTDFERLDVPEECVRLYKNILDAKARGA